MLILVGLQLGCSDHQQVKIFPVAGKLLIDKKVPEKAIVYFHPQQVITGANPVPFGVVDAGGTYRPSTYIRDDGLPSGEYTVTIVWPRYIEFDGQEIASDDRLAGKYADPTKSSIKIRITADTVELPTIEL